MDIVKGDRVLVRKGMKSLPGLVASFSFSEDVEGKVIDVNKDRVLVDVPSCYNVVQYSPSDLRKIVKS